ncbi:MAG: hypothetical protein EXR65_03830 [Dehalococcoidia bacterium]|nr:hypothetical protein [Dehalococcoidia bacterium]
MSTASLILHVLAAAMLVGGELLLFIAVTPASWLIDDERLRRAVTRVIARRFAMLTVIALVVLLATGLYQLLSNDFTPTQLREHPGDYRWGSIFILKMALTAALLVMIGIHGAVLGPRIARASDRADGDADGDGDGARVVLEGLRRNSLLFSLGMLLVSVAVLALGVALADHNFSFARAG